MANDVEKSLRTDGARWRDELTERESGEITTESAPSEHLVRLPLDTSARQSGRRTAVALAAAAAVLILSSVAFIATRHRTTAPPAAQPTPTASSSIDPKQPQQPLNLAARGEKPTAAKSAEATTTSLNMPWRLSAINDAARTVDIYFVEGDGDCVLPQGIQVDETPTSVTIDALSSQLSSANSSCASLLKTGWATVRLKSALANRVLLHPAVASGWALPGE